MKTSTTYVVEHIGKLTFFLSVFDITVSMISILRYEMMDISPAKPYFTRISFWPCDPESQLTITNVAQFPRKAAAFRTADSTNREKPE